MKKQQKNEQMKAGESQKAGGESHSRWLDDQEETEGRTNTEGGKIGYILLWALGVPIPILGLVYLLRGCN